MPCRTTTAPCLVAIEMGLRAPITAAFRTLRPSSAHMHAEAVSTTRYNLPVRYPQVEVSFHRGLPTYAADSSFAYHSVSHFAADFPALRCTIIFAPAAPKPLITLQHAYSYHVQLILMWVDIYSCAICVQARATACTTHLQDYD